MEKGEKIVFIEPSRVHQRTPGGFCFFNEITPSPRVDGERARVRGLR
jgi:hypothetical protein